MFKEQYSLETCPKLALTINMCRLLTINNVEPGMINQILSMWIQVCETVIRNRAASMVRHILKLVNLRHMIHTNPVFYSM